MEVAMIEVPAKQTRSRFPRFFSQKRNGGGVSGGVKSGKNMYKIKRFEMSW